MVLVSSRVCRFLIERCFERPRSLTGKPLYGAEAEKGSPACVTTLNEPGRGPAAAGLAASRV